MRKLALILLTVAALTACEKEENVQPTAPTPPVAEPVYGTWSLQLKDTSTNKYEAYLISNEESLRIDSEYTFPSYVHATTKTGHKVEGFWGFPMRAQTGNSNDDITRPKYPYYQ